MKHIGEAWDGLKSQVNQLIQTFNLEQDSKQNNELLNNLIKGNTSIDDITKEKWKRF